MILHCFLAVYNKSDKEAVTYLLCAEDISDCYFGYV